MDEIEVPALFLCPISLQLMRDPVTVCTGITYDRENIARWGNRFLGFNHDEHKPKDSTFMSEVAIEVLFHLNPSGGELKNLINKEGIQFIESLFQVLKFGNNQSRGYATMLLKSTFEVADPIQLNSVRTELFVEITRVLRDQISEKASKAALKLLVELCSWGRNRVKAVEGGVVFVLVELLLQVSERRVCELMLMVLDKLCGCAEGRAELLKHGAGVAIVAKKILRISHGASDRGVRILASICRYSATPRVLQEMLIFGAVSKLCLVLEVEGSFKAKDRAREILKLHSAVWKNSSCIPQHLLSSYP
ncbi:Zinc finger, RING/FYVE/PHD-type [Sesbania bispinosa]|nr:Zinc finger, RING/FYVE/PHD-type [Sesbania bispinosa]